MVAEKVGTKDIFGIELVRHSVVSAKRNAINLVRTNVDDRFSGHNFVMNS